MNADRLSAAYHEYQPPADFLSIPVWLSSGNADQVARPGAEEGVLYSLKRSGFQQVRLEHFSGGHTLDSAEIQRALHWFREVGRF
jgi:predicted esterase